jgi:hypothetical protein
MMLNIFGLLAVGGHSSPHNIFHLIVSKKVFETQSYDLCVHWTPNIHIFLYFFTVFCVL